MPKRPKSRAGATILEIILGIVVLALLVATVVLFARVSKLEKKLELTYQGVVSITGWAQTEAAKTRTRFGTAETNIETLGKFHRLELPPGGGVPADPRPFPP